MARASTEPRTGISILEIIIILAILALVAVVAIPGYRRTALKEQAAELRKDLESVEQAVRKAAEINDFDSGKKLKFEDYKIYIVGAKRLRETGKGPKGQDYGIQEVGVTPQVPAADFERYRSVADETYWAPFSPGSE